MERGEFPTTRLYNHCNSPPAQEIVFKLSGAAGPHAVLAVVNTGYFICACTAAWQSRTLQKAAAFDLTRLTPLPPHMFLTDLSLFFCNPHRKDCYFRFFLREHTNKKNSCWKWLTEPYAVVLRIQCSNKHVVSISEGWKAEGSLAVKAFRVGVPGCFCSHSVTCQHRCSMPWHSVALG